MNRVDDLRIGPLTEELLGEVVRIHRAGLEYTLNSRLGPQHMKYLYRSMAGDPSCYVGVALLQDRPAGVVSGSTDADAFVSRLFRSMTLGRLAGIAAQMLLHPRFVQLWLQGARIAAPLEGDGDIKGVRAVLTAIAVDEGIQGKGIGRALVHAFEDFLKRAGVHIYRLDTQVSNEKARTFYGGLGFVEAAQRADSIVFVRRLS